MVSEAGIEANPRKVQSLLSLSSPSSIKELTSFIQKVRYFGRFIHLLTQLMLPLQNLTKAEKLEWDEESEECFFEEEGVKNSSYHYATFLGTRILCQPKCWG